MLPFGVLIQQILDAGTAPSTLLTDINAYFEFEQSSLPMTDSTGTTANNIDTAGGVPEYQKPGKRGYSALIFGGSEYLRTSGTHNMTGGQRDYTIAGWWYPTTVSGWKGVLSCGTGQLANQSDYVLTGNGTTLTWYVPSGSTWYSVSETSALAADTWVFFVCSYTAATDTLTMTLNNGTPRTSVGGGSCTAKGGHFYYSYYYNYATGQGMGDMWGFWPRILTADEQTELWNDGLGRTYAELQVPPTILTSMVSYWELNVDSGTRVDSHGPNNLTDNDTVTQSLGKRGYSAQFVRTNTEWLSVTAGHGLEAGNRDFSMCGWIYADTLPSLAIVGGVSDGSGPSDIDYVVQLESSTLKFYVEDTGNHSVSSSVTITTDTWFFVYVEYEANTNLMGISVNGGALETAVGPTTPNNMGGPFALGQGIGISSRFWDGRIDLWGFWARRLTSTEREFMRNDDFGRIYSELVTVANPLLASLGGHWPLNEALNETRKDLHGNNPVRDIGGVDLVAGEADFSGGGDYLTQRYISDLNTGDNSWSVCGFVSADSLAPTILDTFFGISDYSYVGNGNDGFHVGYRTDNERFDLTVRVGSTRNFVNATTAGKPTAGQKYWLYAYFDADNDEIGISIDDGVVDTAALTGTPNTKTQALTMGRLGPSGGGGYFLDGAMSDWWFFNKVLTAAEVTEMSLTPTYASMNPPVVPTYIGITNETVSNNGSTDITLEAHADVEEGDLMVMIAVIRNMLSIGLPTGGATWAELESWEVAQTSMITPPGGGTNDWLYIWTKIAGASETTQTITNTDDGVDGAAVSLIVIRNATTVTTPTMAATLVAPEQTAETYDLMLTFHGATYDTSAPSSIFAPLETGLISKIQSVNDSGLAIGIQEKLPLGLTGDRTWFGLWNTDYNFAGMVLIR